jgi:hypothetical protein
MLITADIILRVCLWCRKLKPFILIMNFKLPCLFLQFCLALPICSNVFQFFFLPTCHFQDWFCFNCTLAFVISLPHNWFGIHVFYFHALMLNNKWNYVIHPLFSTFLPEAWLSIVYISFLSFTCLTSFSYFVSLFFSVPYW